MVASVPVSSAGATVTVTQAFTDETGVAFNPDTITLKYRKPDGSETTVVKAAMTSTVVGTWSYSIATLVSDEGLWTYRWDGVRNAPLLERVTEGGFRTTSVERDVPSVIQKPKLRPCTPWIADVTQVAGDTELDVDRRQLICDAATEVVWALSGRRFGSCSATVRPCQPSWGMRYPSWLPWYSGFTYPGLPPAIGWWWETNCGCGTVGTCGCDVTSEIKLPRKPIISVDQVKVDGAVLVNGVDYRVDDFRRLVRLNPAGLATPPQWPLTQNLNLDDTQVGTWSVTWTWGTPVPALGVLAAEEMAAELVKAFATGDCSLPNRVTNIIREGVTVQLLDPVNYLKDGQTGLKTVDLFVMTYNKGRLASRSRIFRADSHGPRFRRTAT